MTVTYLDGRFVDDDEAKVSVTDHSFLYGDGCFEGIGIFDGKILHLDEHVDRLFRSARMLRIPVPVSKEELRELIIETARRNGMDATPQGYLRPLLSRGAGPLGIKWSVGIERPTLVIIPQLSDRKIGYGGDIGMMSAAVTNVVRPSSASVDPRIKSNNYLTAVLAFLEAHDRGADVGILKDERGFLVEGYAMNLFCVREGRVLTPHESAALAGITRKNVLVVLEMLGVECVETELTTYDFICADEAFVTSSLEGVAAISSIDSHPLTGAPGPITVSVRKLYNQRALEDAVPVGARSQVPSGGRSA
jgi:branched-chain amino acid aminotransferase